MKVRCLGTLLKDRKVWIIEIENNFNDSKTLLLSKVSEALYPNMRNNHIGEGGTMDDFLNKQNGVKFIINGGFNHYRKDFYNWPNKNFNVGDPVGLIKVREHYFEDYLTADGYGFFIQEKKHETWKIVEFENLNKSSKYILGCTPLLIKDGKKLSLNLKTMLPVNPGEINPPSYLGHGLENHPRTAVGIKENTIVFLLVEEDNVFGGGSLLDLQNIGMDIGLKDLLNLDGGGSSQFRFKDNDAWLSNYVSEENKKRILGNVIVLFEN